MTNFDSTLHPRGNPLNKGQFKVSVPTPTNLVISNHPTTAEFGEFPVHLTDLPNVGNYQFSASALVESAGGMLAPYFSQREFDRLIEVTNQTELESDDQLVVERAGADYQLRSATGETWPLPSIDTAFGRLWALDADGGSTEFELTEGQWFADGGTDHNFTEMVTDRATGDTFDRSWTVRRDDGQYVRRTVTWFVEEYDDSESLGVDEDDQDEAGNVLSYSVFTHTEDTIASEWHGSDREVMEDADNEDHLETDRVFSTVEDAQDFARARANGAEAYFHVSDWDGYEA